jgi:hypothetical protein
MKTFSNLPANTAITSDQKVVQYFDNYYTTPINLDVTDVDLMTSFFQEKGFDDGSASNIAFLILKTAKQSNYKTQEILEALTSYNSDQLNDFLMNILNFNRAKTSTLGSIKKFDPAVQIKRNIRA